MLTPKKSVTPEGKDGKVRRGEVSKEYRESLHAQLPKAHLALNPKLVGIESVMRFRADLAVIETYSPYDSKLYDSA